MLQYRGGVLLRDYSVRNKILWDGKVDLLNQFFRNTGGFWSNFYIGLLKNTFGGFNLDEPTMVSISAAQFTGYSEANRPTITFAAAERVLDANNIYVKSSAYSEFNITAPDTLTGVFVANTNVKADTPSHVWCTAAFGNVDNSPVSVPVAAADVLRIEYTVRIPKA